MYTNIAATHSLPRELPAPTCSGWFNLGDVDGSANQTEQEVLHDEPGERHHAGHLVLGWTGSRLYTQIIRLHIIVNV